MVTRVLLIILLFAMTISALAAPPDMTFISDAAQDSGGQVWGAEGWRPDGRLHQWQGDHWADLPMPFALDYEADALARGDDGRVYCVWQAPSGPECLVSVHTGDSSRLLARFPGAMRRDNGTGIAPNLYAGRDGAVWVTGQSSRLWRITPGGQVHVYPIPNTWFLPGRTPQKNDNYYDPIGSVTDGQGRRWFWSNDLAEDMPAACLRGVLIWNGRQLAHHPTLPGVPDKPFSVIAPEDARQLWVAVPNDGLYEVDAATLKGRRVTPPERGAFQNIERIFRVGGDCYLADSATTPDERSIVLWRQRSGRWQKVVRGLDKNADTVYQQPGRPWLATPAGLWVGAFGGGVWWLPARDGPPVPVDWRRGFPLNLVERLFRLPDGRILAEGDSSVAFAPTPPARLPLPTPPARTFLTTANLGDLVSDSRRHLWSVLAADTRRLSEWDGQAWRKHPIPKNVPLDKFNLFAQDTQGRLWLLPWNHDGPAAVFDPARESWAAFPTCEAAYATQSAVPGFALHTDSRQLMPSYGPGGKICFMSEWGHVHLFDGRMWHEWEAGQIVGEKDAGVDKQPFFNKAGNPSLTWGQATWEWTADKGWHSIAFVARPDDDQQQNQPAAPPGSPVPHPDSLALAGPDMAWETYHRQLYKVAFGLSAPQFPSGKAHPFLDGRSLNGVLNDSRGNTFLRTTGSWYSEHVLLTATPPPDTSVNVTPTASDSVRVDVTTHTPGRPWFVWRLDGGAWSAAAHTGTATLDFLPGGPHRVEALTLDARLNFAPKPAQASFFVEADPAKQVAALVVTLKTGDADAREAAVTRLRRFPALATPALKAARVGATEDQCWWIDAALQQVTEEVKGR